MRELGGRTHVLPHNGDLPGIFESSALPLDVHRPVDQTDSEHDFCALRSRLGPLWTRANPPSLQARLSQLAAFSAELRSLGPANFLYADGDTLFAHGHRRVQRASRRVEPPGLWMLQRHCSPDDAPSVQTQGAAIAPAQRSVLWIACESPPGALADLPGACCPLCLRAARSARHLNSSAPSSRSTSGISSFSDQ